MFDTRFFEYFGLIVCSYTAIKYTWSLLKNLGTFYMGFGKINLKKYGSWAVVTGATDGIGKSYANSLAAKGLNIVLISRTKSKLESIAKEIEEKYSVETQIVIADYTEQTSIYPDIKRQINDLDIGILVNNVGMAHDPDFLENVTVNDDFVSDMINCNVTSVTKMTGIILPKMVKKGGGVIVNISSASGRIPVPFLTIYSSTKAYMDFFSKATQLEYKSKGIIVQSVCPYFVSTKMTGMKPTYWHPAPDNYVSYALETIGSQSLTNGCPSHNIQGFVYEQLFPRSFFDHLVVKALTKSMMHKKHKNFQAKKAN